MPQEVVAWPAARARGRMVAAALALATSTSLGVLFTLFSLPVPSPAQAAGKELSALVGKPLSAARSSLLAGGWEPQETALTTSRGELERTRGEAARLVDAGYPEVERCTGSSKNYCFFNYRRGGKCMRVRTLGVLTDSGGEPKVHGVGDACPSKQARRP